MQEIARQPGGWILYEIAGGRLVLSVNCGSVASYEISLELSSTEANSYRENGVQSVDVLANQVMSYPRQFGARNVTLQEGGVVPAPLSWHQ